MQRAFSGTGIRAAEEPLLRTGQGPVLMQRAAHGLANAVARLLAERRGRVYGARIVLLAGPGNNGGDALYAASFLLHRGARATAVLSSAGAHEQALEAFRRAGGRTHTLPGPEEDTVNGPTDDNGSRAPAAIAAQVWLAEAAAADVLIDAILGTGARGSLRAPWANAVRALQQNAAAEKPGAFGKPNGPLIVACDLPSGVDANTGELHEPVLTAGLTVTFGAAKTGLLAPPGEGASGRLQVIDIGLGHGLEDPVLRRLESGDLALLLPSPGRDEQKYTRGVLGVVAGSGQYPGAAQLSCAGALACGTGMVRYLGPESVAALIHLSSPEVVCSQGSVEGNHVQAWLVGPGIGEAGESDVKEQLQRCRDAYASGLPVVADAGALAVLPAQLSEGTAPHVILTPHAGELAQLFQRLGRDVSRPQIEAQGMHFAVEAAKLTGATVLLKGATTLVASPSGSVFSQSEGTPWLATAGSGDTLAGIIGALLAALAAQTSGFSALGIPAEDRWAAIAAAGASLHGRAGVLASAGGPLHAAALAAAVPEVWRKLYAPGPVT
ncbi:bifunctional ADP-dependent NAD(P)H-hydrate dehydratase/NAD(P)H-hydrate epimerase [Arthrobacter sp. H14-L1]|uniref:bifunctional ADP-dependent NAD(P)H-hydrate dehydratase/NAD(P)H-hydrate epimerase n=1 Tax=Arthrobacter sp. H14-L1 TaxID=2996697 RepID=UPI00226D7819|nr:bifunctional ADP-dependent NAD(P)H-hydrate dehydratase/NAD(P)H-hydrate epimerase [Arthrobacter sp. H14-L1]MCY0904435.1 bifunctional ADP-dependent NAD(P)H-hydrate dehydratase/NAD(P)H-hydrate epimerase [Arthrobacter sp. H14-L1]